MYAIAIEDGNTRDAFKTTSTILINESQDIDNTFDKIETGSLIYMTDDKTDKLQVYAVGIILDASVKMQHNKKKRNVYWIVLTSEVKPVIINVPPMEKKPVIYKEKREQVIHEIAHLLTW